MKIIKLKNKKGFSLLEVLVAMGLVSMCLIGISSLAVQNIQVQTVNKNQLIASMLAQEGVELVRNIRDDNWLDPTEPNWYDYIYEDIAGVDGPGETTKTFTIHAVNNLATPWDRNYVPDDFSHDETYLYVDVNGFYTHDELAGVRKTNFQRLITVNIYDSNGDSEEDVMKLIVEVQWLGLGKISNYVVETYLYDWR